MRKIVFIVIFILISVNSFADSIFSPNGFVEENYGLDNFSTGMGQTGISSIFRRNFSVCNPALNTTVKKTNFFTKMDFGYNYFKDSNDKFEDKIASFPYVSIIIPVGSSIFLGAKFFEKYHLGLETSNEDSLENIGKYFADIIYDGSINQIGLSIAKKIKNISIGINYNYNFGNKIKELSIDFDDNELEKHFEKLERFYDCTNFSIGINFPISKFSFGGFYESKLKLNSNEKYTIEFASNPDFDLIEESNRNIVLPSQIGLGIGVKPAEFLFIETDYRQTFWKNATNEKMNKRDSKFYSFGISYLPHRKIFWKIATRLGGYYKQLPCKINENFIDEKGLTFGFDIPLQVKNKGGLSLAFVWGVRGEVSKNLYSDEFVKVSIGFFSIDWWENPKKYKKDRKIPELGSEFRLEY